MKDQYGNAIPADLRVLPSYCLLSEAEREFIFSIPWYEVDGMLLAECQFGDHPRDAGLEVDEDGNIITESVLVIDEALKRGNNVDDFYHA